MHRSTIGVAVLSCLASGILAALDGHCPPLGAVIPPPTSPSLDPVVTAAVAAFTRMLENTTAPYNRSAVAIGVKSIHESDKLLEYAYTPPDRDARGVQQVDSNTVFRLASTAKVFPVLALLMLHGVSLDDSITKYVPELRALNRQAREQTPIWTIDWDAITLGTLASHLGGIPADMTTDITPYGNYSSYGFPPVDESKLLGCSGLLGLAECNRTVFFARFGERAPVQAPFSQNTVYSNIGFALLGFVVEKVTNKPFEDFLVNEVWKPAGMEHTFPAKPDDALGFIPTDDQWWNATLGFMAPAGAYYSTINDLHRFGDAVLKYKYLSAARTRKWFKPVTSTSSSGLLIGQPWEILRAQNVTEDGRLIELYTKGGDLSSYHSLIAFIPDYDLVATILVAGPEVSGGLVLLLFSQLIQTLLPGIEQAGKSEAQMAYGGTYADPSTNSTVTISLDNSPGFNISNWFVRGVDISATYAALNLPPIVPPPPVPLIKFRLYPTTVISSNQTSWRAVGGLATAEQVAEVDSLFVWPMTSCSTWALMDRITYLLQAQDLFIFTLDEGKATELELVGYGVHLKRV